jgi:hypothetical protein
LWIEINVRIPQLKSRVRFMVFSIGKVIRCLERPYRTYDHLQADKGTPIEPFL